MADFHRSLDRALQRQHETVAALPKSTLSGWVPEVGSLVWQQLYSPVEPAHDSTIEERLEHGETYGPRFLTRVLGVVRDYDGREGVHRIHTKDDGCGPGLFPAKGHGPSWAETDWGVWEDASAEEGALF